MSSDNPSSAEEKKITDNDIAFAIITKDSVRVMAEAAGHADISDEVAALLSEDISYRLREVTMNSTQFMKHGKRRKLVTEDFNRALRGMDVQPIYGHGSSEALSFKQTRDGDIHFVEDGEVNFCDIALGRYVPKNLGETSIKADWLAVEGIPKSSSTVKIKKELSEDMLNYYNNITKALLSSEADVRKVALDDIRKNPNIVPLLSYFVNYVCYGVKTVSYDITKLTILLHTIKSLINNPSLDLTPHPYLNLLVQAVMYNLTEPVAASFNNQNDHWSLRDYASRLLGEIVLKWSNPLNHLLYNTVKELKDVLFDLNKPFCSHYGAIMGLIALGNKTIEEILLPNLSTFWSHLNVAMEDISIRNALVRSDAYKVYGALLLAAELLLKNRFEEFKKEHDIGANSDNSNEAKTMNINNSSSGFIFGGANVVVKSPQELYQELYEYFGDSLTVRVDKTAEINFKEIFPPLKDDVLVSLSDADGAKSGEALLEEFMEQVRVQEILDREKKVQEEKERIIREKMEAKQRIVQQQRDAEEKKRRQIQELLKQKQEEELARQRWEEEMKKREEAVRKEREKRRRIERRKREEERRRLEEERRREELMVTSRVPRREASLVVNYKEDDDDIDVEADDDSDYVPDRPVVIERKSDHSDNTDEYNSDKGYNPPPPPPPYPGPSQESVALTSTITNPGGGIKIKIKRQPTLKSYDMEGSSSLSERTPERKEKETKDKQKRKRKSSQKSFDPFEFGEKSDTDDYASVYPPPLAGFVQQYKSPGTGESSGSDNSFRKSKLTLKLKVPSKDSTPE
ncbi:hypothetical protein SNE40_010208 [Patella caerulea]|uniref:Histone H4 n=1 Tax=Patella caerulea TaxID=87958 RepID=A0AAN8JXH7_PATCE